MSIHGICDDNLAEILGRLPSKSLLRCRAVCKTWRRIATSHLLLADHASRRPIQVITYSPVTLQVKATPLSVDSDSHARARPTAAETTCPTHLCYLRKVGAGGSTFIVLYSLDGLLLLHQRAGFYVVCNPITRQWTNLPALVPHPCFIALTCGFYLQEDVVPSGSGEYRLLCHCLEEVELHGAAAAAAAIRRRTRGGDDWEYTKRHCYYVLSTAAGTLPRRLAASPVTTGWDFLFTKYGTPVAHRGILHWSQHPQATSTGKILSFDTVSETFRLMSLPPPPDPERRRSSGGDTDTAVALLMLDGVLSVAVMLMPQQGVTSSPSLDIWALQDYEAEVWTLRHRVELPPPPPELRQFSHLVPQPTSLDVLSLGNSAILIGKPYCTFGVARVYHLKDKKVIRQMSFYGSMVLTFLAFKESCVSHAFFDSPRSPDTANINFSEDKDGEALYCSISRRKKLLQ